MKLKTSLIAGAALAVCSISSFAATSAGPNLSLCTAAALATPVTSAAAAEAIVQNCAPAATLFIGGASTMSGNLPLVLPTAVFDTTKMTPIVITDKGSLTGSPSVANASGNVNGYLGVAQSTVKGVGGQLVFVVYNFNNGSAGGVSQLLGKLPKLSAMSGVTQNANKSWNFGTASATAIPEADVVFVGPTATGAAAQTTPGTKAANAFCGTTGSGFATAATTFAGIATYNVSCTSHNVLQADLALSDARAEELYAVYPAAAGGKLSTLVEQPLFVESFGVVVSAPLYAALQEKTFGVGNACISNYTSAACQPSISRADYTSLIMSGGSIKQLSDLVGATNQTAAAAISSGAVLHVARRDDLSGTQAASNIYFANGQCGGNDRESSAVTIDGNNIANAYFGAKSIDVAVAKAGGLLGGLAIRSNGDAEAASIPGLDIQINPTSGQVKSAVGSASNYVIGVLGVGGGGVVSGNGYFVKIDGMSPNADSQGNFLNSTATRNQLASGAYNFATVMHAIYTTAEEKNATQFGLVQAVINGFQNSNLTNLSGIAYLDGSTSGVAARQSHVTRVDSNNKPNNCAPLHRL